MQKQHAIVLASTTMRQGGILRYYKNYHIDRKVYYTNNKFTTIKMKVCKYCDSWGNAKKAKKQYFHCGPF